jgi:hypothetical protein
MTHRSDENLPFLLADIIEHAILRNPEFPDRWCYDPVREGAGAV